MISMTRGLKSSWLLVALVCACSGERGGVEREVDPSATPDVPGELDSGTDVTVTTPPALAALTQELAVVQQATPDATRARHTVEFAADLGYDPLLAPNLGTILHDGGFVAPDAIKARLSQTGFAIDARSHLSSFALGYSQIYAADLPVFISSDMVLEAIYRSHDKILQALEKKALRPRLQKFLASVRSALIEQAGTLDPDTASDLNFYLGVAISLLDGGKVDPREPEGVKSFVNAAMNAAGEQRRVFFGVERRIDFSQFKPRGHYDGDKDLESYFRAMIWLGRIDFRLLETKADGRQVLRRRQVESVVALRRLLSSAALSDYRSIDAVLSAFVGEHDYMTLEQVDDLLGALGAPNGLAGVSDTALVEAIVAGEFGAQRIASHVMRRGPGPDTFPLNASFALFGQRYTVDSHVFSNVVYDRVPTRILPDPLDAAFAALGNDQALGLLGAELEQEAGYAGQLASLRRLVDAHPQEYWESSLYTTWLSALRALSPAASPSQELPAVARTEAWGRRLLNTQLSSWAQLRHNNVLYVKQSYTSDAACEYPDAYVDPYPEFFRAAARLGERAQELLAGLDLDPSFVEQVQGYFERVRRINLTLADMALAQRSGAPHTAEHMAFINQAVTTNVNCDGTVLGHTGWYSELHFDPLQAVEMDPTITDVHTDIGGDLPVRREPSVLHVGTGLPRKIVVTVDSCEGPRAYVGVVSSYNELLAEGLTRLTDDDWKDRVLQGNVPVVPWLAPILTQ